MSRNKTSKFEANRRATNIIQAGKPLFEGIKGKWRESFFKNPNPIIVELGCGRGEYSVGLAQLDQEKNYIGVDIKGDRIYRGSQEAISLGLKNVGFLRTKIHDIENFFEEGEIDGVWITFPDPRPKKRDIRRRITNPRFLEIYWKLCKPGSQFHLKTDNSGFFDYSLEVLQNYDIGDMVITRDLYNSEYLKEHHGITTKYEKIWTEKGSKIHYLRFKMI